ncbi:hypothetical protein C8A01DRAFT_41677 [Parachaetomium inaequale]|uniref:Uncharacterized protein n=1 Tax=Parachaetomium inaequale TaxID=2588326 RepID=A0AAN6P9E9_9PEZI|nr:hypothetical protein C8A01DRAFT_41677 [Parachaetomium inaequale]
MIDLVVDPLWQAADTVTLKANTQALVDFLARTKRGPEFDQLWRIVPRFMHCLPPELFDGRRLVYDAENVSIGGTEVRNPIWPGGFCKALRGLVTHPFFRRSPRMLAIAVQYAVKLRTNDRRRWPIEDPTTGTFINNLATAFGNAHHDGTTQEIHKEVRRAVKAQGKDMPLVSIVLREIENAVGTPTEEDFTGSVDPFDPYLVTVTDIKKVATALDNVKSCGVTVYNESDYVFTSVKSALHSNDLPHKVSGVTDVLQVAYQRIAQSKILRERRAAANAAANSSSQAAGLENENIMLGNVADALRDENDNLKRNVAELQRLRELDAAELQRRELDAAELQRLRQVDAAEMDRLREELERAKAVISSRAQEEGHDDQPMDFPPSKSPSPQPSHSLGFRTPSLSVAPSSPPVVDLEQLHATTVRVEIDDPIPVVQIRVGQEA